MANMNKYKELGEGVQCVRLRRLVGHHRELLPLPLVRYSQDAGPAWRARRPPTPPVNLPVPCAFFWCLPSGMLLSLILVAAPMPRPHYCNVDRKLRAAQYKYKYKYKYITCVDLRRIVRAAVPERGLPQACGLPLSDHIPNMSAKTPQHPNKTQKQIPKTSLKLSL